jgi:hypothetical protein
VLTIKTIATASASTENLIQAPRPRAAGRKISAWRLPPSTPMVAPRKMAPTIASLLRSKPGSGGVTAPGTDA